MPFRLTHWKQLAPCEKPDAKVDVNLCSAVRGFFENGGQECWLIPDRPDAPDLDRYAWWEQCLEELEVDVLCAPTLARPGNEARLVDLQSHLLESCARPGCFAILDASVAVLATDSPHLQWDAHARRNGALYHPWVLVQGGCRRCRGQRQVDGIQCAECDGRGTGLVPPCGHVAGIYARVDARRGLHKAPANEELLGIIDVADALTDTRQGELNRRGINCLRVFQNQGILLWGARTLSLEPDWRYINVSRLLLSVEKTLRRLALEAVFEPNDQRLWAWLSRTLNSYLGQLFQRGALRGSTPLEAFYVRCDAQTNPPGVREQGLLLAEVGLAPILPGEFIVLRLLQGPGGASVAFNP